MPIHYQLPQSFQSNYIIFDSRNFSLPNHSLFWAIKGVHHNGHDFVLDMYRAGVREFILQKNAVSSTLLNDLQKLHDADFYITENSVRAFQEFVKIKRNNFNIPVIGITGSNGKTIIKEWLAQLIQKKLNVLKSPRSFNSQIGVPVSIWPINETHQIGIFEAGISQVGEMDFLANMINPTIGIITNIGTAHNEYFENDLIKLKEKIKLFKNSKTLIYNIDNEFLAAHLQDETLKINPNVNFISWSFLGKGKLNFKLENKINFNLLTFENHTLKIPFFDQASIENIGNVISCLITLGYNISDFETGLERLQAVDMRLKKVDGNYNNTVIDDSYSNDLDSLKLALNYLNQQNGQSENYLILSDFMQILNHSSNPYQEVAQLLKQFNNLQLIAVGPQLIKNKTLFEKDVLFFETTEETLNYLKLRSIKNAAILIKGARFFQFEKIVSLFQHKLHQTVLEVNLDDVVHNLNYYRKLIGPNFKMMAMVKALAYGAGNVEIAQLLQHHKIDYLGVAYTDEGVNLRKKGIFLPIMIMNPAINDFGSIIEYKLEPEIYSNEKLLALADYLYENNLTAKIHIKLDTGMHRLGFMAVEIPALLETLKANPNIIVASIFSHLAASEDTAFDDFTKTQLADFNSMADQIIQTIGYKPILHILNSAGINRFESSRLDMVRLGIGLYGVSNNLENRPFLRPVSTLKTTVSQIKTLLAGQSVGYGRKGQITETTTIATIAIGYADGLDRRFGNGNLKVSINGKLCPTIGNICMDLTMVNLGDTNAKEGDEVFIFGGAANDLYELSEQIGTIPYELLTNVGERVKRIFYKS